MLWKIFGEGCNSNHFKIAKQISLLLNKYNNLTINYDTNKILYNEIKYRVMIDNNDNVIAVIGIFDSILRHFCVDPKYRNTGIGYFLLSCFEKDTKLFVKYTNYKCLSIALQTKYRIIEYIPISQLFLLKRYI